jgi:hypothetical protein
LVLITDRIWPQNATLIAAQIAATRQRRSAHDRRATSTPRDAQAVV